MCVHLSDFHDIENPKSKKIGQSRESDQKSVSKEKDEESKSFERKHKKSSEMEEEEGVYQRIRGTRSVKSDE